MDKVFWEGVDEVGEKGEALPAGEEEFVVELVVEEEDGGGDPAQVGGETRYGGGRRWRAGWWWNCFCPAPFILVSTFIVLNDMIEAYIVPA